MPYYSYHNRIQQLIKEKKLIGYKWVFEKFNSVVVKDHDILVLIFKDERDRPIRPHRQDEYLQIIKDLKIPEVKE